MTANLPADAHRPTPSTSRPPIFRTPSRQSSGNGPRIYLGRGPPSQYNLPHEPSAPEPPSKRRKVESPAPAPIDSNVPQAQVSPAQNQPRLEGQDSRPSPGDSAERLLPLDFREALKLGTTIWAEDIDPGQVRSTADAPPLPLPKLPWRKRANSADSATDTRHTQKRRLDVTVPTTPCKLEEPDDGPRYQQHNIADFFPWAGNHPEDVLNEQTVKNGQYDKPPQTTNESSTAKATLYNTFKHRFGLQTLSSLFGAVLQQRGESQKITSEATFKPPPRVTLTEAKRRQWLNDLASPSVPLRRLSRTIPQGIRGQLLLEQCQVNGVPISRAIWFAKCVGANEIRTLKRKGTTAPLAAKIEAKWHKEWTLSVQHFVEACIENCGKPNWRNNLSYSLRLATRLFLESLLDRDCFLDWILSSMKSCSLERTPFWLMMVHVHGKELTRTRRRGRLLAETLVEKYVLARERDEEICRPITDRLGGLIKSFVQSRPACFLIPERWQQVKDVLERCLDVASPARETLLGRLAQANERVCGPSHQAEVPKLTSRQRLIKILDGARAPFDLDRLEQDCKSTCADAHLLISTMFEWSCSRFRDGRVSVYMVSRIFQKWRKAGQDIDGAVFARLVRPENDDGIDATVMHHVIVELIRSAAFSVSRYLQWISGRRGTSNCFGELRESLTFTHDGVSTKVNLPICHDPMLLLTEMPTSHLPHHMSNLRSGILARAGFDVEIEAAIIHHCKCYLKKRLSESIPPLRDFHPDADYSRPDFKLLGWSVKSHISNWLCVAARASLKSEESRHPETAGAVNLSLSVDHFCVVRDVLESMGDTSSLAGILQVASKSSDEDVLISVTDTVSAHVEELSVIGLLEGLCSSLWSSYLSMKTMKSSIPMLTISLLELLSDQPDTVPQIRTLQEDLVRGDKPTAITAYSPFSEGMAESLQQAGTTFVEDFEAVLQSEPTMSEQKMKQLFSVVMDRLVKSSPDIPTEDGLTLLLVRLRVFRPASFDKLIAAWMRSVLGSATSAIDVGLWLRLYSTGCLKMTTICASLLPLRVHGGTPEPSKTQMDLQTMLHRALNDDATGSDSEEGAYRLRADLTRFMNEASRQAFEVRLYLASQEQDQQRFSLDGGPVAGLLYKVDSQDLEKLDADMSMSLEAELDRYSQPREEHDPTESQIVSLLNAVNDFSLEACCFRLRMLVARADSASSISQEDIVNALFSLACTTDSSSSNHWLALTNAAGSDITFKLRQKAEQAFFCSFGPFAQSNAAPSPFASLPEETATDLDRLVDIMSKLSQTIAASPTASICSQLLAKLVPIWRALSAQNQTLPPGSSPFTSTHLSVMPTSSPASASAPSPAPGGPTSIDLPALRAYLPLLFKITCLHRGSLLPPANTPSTKAFQQDHINLLMLLVSIALHPALAAEGQDQPLVAHILDVAAVLVDGVSDEARALTARCLKGAMRDPRVAFLFATGNAAAAAAVGQGGGGETGLQVVKEGRGVVGEWKARQWEMLEGSAETGVNLGLFGARAESGRGR